tara:strand:- start:480 stop:2264 length:1785 start_codon:yes stop_codon:yes gene_type:complete
MVRHRVFLVLIFSAVVASILYQWWLLVGFDPADKRWWEWLLSNLKKSGGLPAGMDNSVLYAGIVGALIMALGSILLPQAGSKTKSGEFAAKALHGTASWARVSDLRKAGLFAKRGIQVGGWKRRFRRAKPLRHDGPEHVLCFAPTRSGKGVSLIIPALLSWPDTAIILDIKGENYQLTAGYRAQIGQRIIRFDPTALAPFARFNPLAEIRLGSGREIQDAQNIALTLIDPEGKGLKDHWMREGASWLTGAILHVLFRNHQCVGHPASLNDVRGFLSQSADEGESENEDPMDALLDAMLTFDHGDPVIDREVEAAAKIMRLKDWKERSGVHSTALASLSLLSDPILARNTEASDFAISDLAGDQKTSFYLVIPPSDLERLRPITRIIFAMILRRLTETLDGRIAERKILLLMDEFTSLGKIDVFETSLAYLAGYGVKAFLFVQDLQMLKGIYGQQEAITSNCHVQIAFAPNRYETAKTVSDMAGRATVIQSRRSASGSIGGRGSVSQSETETGRSLLTPDEAMRLGRIRKNWLSRSLPGEWLKKCFGGMSPGEAILLVAGSRPIRGVQLLYFQNRALRKRASIPAPSVAMVHEVG